MFFPLDFYFLDVMRLNELKIDIDIEGAKWYNQDTKQERKINNMMVYVVLLDGAYGAQIEKIFTIKTKAEAYRAELQKQHPCYCFYIEEHWAI